MHKEGNKRCSHASLCFGNILGAPGLQGGGDLLHHFGPGHGLLLDIVVASCKRDLDDFFHGIGD